MKIRLEPRWTSLFALAFAAPLPSAAHAQSTEDNAVENAEDAFGTATSHEQIGVYDEGNVRGFSPGSAGNYRMEGMYFDIQGGLGGRVIDGETIRVGPATQGYAFPAPTGIVDLQLKKVGEKSSIAPFASWDSFGSRSFEIDSLLPLDGKRLGIAAGIGVADNAYANGGGSRQFSAGIVPRWRPGPNVEILTFASHQQIEDETSQPIYISTGNFLPKRMKRANFVGPDWAIADSRSDTFGMVGHAHFGDWTVRTGLFRSAYHGDGGFSNLVFVAPDSSTERQVFATPASASVSYSGELRISRRFSDGPRQHLLMVSLRGRSIDANYGGGDLAILGPAGLDEQIRTPLPSFNFTALTDDKTRQTTAGLSYSLKWRSIGELTAGLQRTHYDKRVIAPLLAPERGTSNVTLPYFSAALNFGPRFTVYGSYVRGLEDAGTAPGYAANANQVLPAIRTRQYDFGLRWSPVDKTTLILGYFEISKPYIDLDVANRYGVLGTQTHRGVEFSVTSNPTSSVRIVAGGVWLDPRVTASPAIAQPVGLRPVNQPRLRTRFNINWTPPFAKNLTLDAYMNRDTGAYATVDNSVYAPGSTRFGVGGRYGFKLGGREFTARVILYNIFDAFEFIPIGSGVFAYNTPRNVQAWLTTEF